MEKWFNTHCWRSLVVGALDICSSSFSFIMIGSVLFIIQFVRPFLLLSHRYLLSTSLEHRSSAVSHWRAFFLFLLLESTFTHRIKALEQNRFNTFVNAAGWLQLAIHSMKSVFSSTCHYELFRKRFLFSLGGSRIPVHHGIASFVGLIFVQPFVLAEISAVSATQLQRELKKLSPLIVKSATALQLFHFNIDLFFRWIRFRIIQICSDETWFRFTCLPKSFACRHMQSTQSQFHFFFDTK